MTEQNKNRRLDELFKAATITAAMLVGYLIGRTSATPPVIDSSSATIRARSLSENIVGQSLSLPGVDWNKNQRTLILALSTTCHFCTESGPFYQRLVRERGRFPNTRLVAVLPQAVDDSKHYLAKLGFSVDAVLQDSLQSINVSRTPTLLLVNGSGVVADLWIGTLQPAAELQVVSRLEAR